MGFIVALVQGEQRVQCAAALAVGILAGACQPPTLPERIIGEGVVQQVVVHDRRVVIAHDDIPGFMPAMTMSFEVRSPPLLAQCTPGERIRFILEKTPQTLYLVAVQRVEGGGSSAKNRS